MKLSVDFSVDLFSYLNVIRKQEVPYTFTIIIIITF